MTSLDLAPRARGHDDALASPRLAGALYAALVALAAAPAWIWPIPRANDIVNHWARLTLYGMAADDPLRALYRVQFGLIPNLGLDALYLALQPFASAQTVTRLALALAIALPALGAWALHRALFAKPSPTIWAIPFLSYNVATTGGLLNFSIGMGLAFLALAVIARRGERLGWREALALNLFGVALFFCHLIAWGAFALLFGLMRVACPPARLRRGAYLVAAQLAPLALVALRQAPPSTYSLGGTKLGILFAPVASMTGSDLTALTLLVAGAALAVVLGLRPAPQARAALAGFALVTLLAPPALGAASLIDARLAVYLWYFAIATSWLDASGAVRGFCALASVAATAWRLHAVAPAWEAFQERGAQVRAGLASLPQGARALVVAPERCGAADFAMFGNLTAFAVIDRRAYVNTLFAQTGIQPSAPADPALDGGPTLPMDSRWLTEDGRASLPARLVEAPWAAPYRDWRRHFTHVIDAHSDCASMLSVPGLTRAGGAAGLDVYRVD